MNRIAPLLLLACAAGDKTPTDTATPDDTSPTDTSPDDTGADDTGAEDACGVDPDRYFPDEAIWHRDVSGAALDPASDEIIAFLQDHGWGLGRLQVDFSIEVLDADASTETRSFVPTEDFYTPDCDLEEVPIPDGGALEGEEGYACESDGDCHLIVVQRDTCRLYEMWRANIVGDTFYGGCLAVWDMSRVYTDEGRGVQCTSADAAGYPIAPLLFTADEVAAGEIRHAIRFILPNSAIRADEFVPPATHSTGAASGPESAPPYGAHLRLRADYPVDTLPSEGAKVVARAMQTYGMFLADGGSVALTAQSDRFSAASWDGLLDPHDLTDIEPADFEVLAMDEPIPLTYECERIE